MRLAVGRLKKVRPHRSQVKQFILISKINSFVLKLSSAPTYFPPAHTLLLARKASSVPRAVTTLSPTAMSSNSKFDGIIVPIINIYMEPNTINNQNQPAVQTKPKASAKDFFLNLGTIVALYTTVISLLNLLFTVINRAYPQVTTYSYNGTYYGSSSSSISWPVAVLIIFFPIFILLMWLLERSYHIEPEKKHLGVRKWLTYITLFIAGLTLAGDLVTVLYFFIDGQELTTGFLLKVFVVLVITAAVFFYYISD